MPRALAGERGAHVTRSMPAASIRAIDRLGDLLVGVDEDLAGLRVDDGQAAKRPVSRSAKARGPAPHLARSRCPVSGTQPPRG